MKAFKNFTDIELLDEVLKFGNTECFGEIYDRYSSQVFAKCISFTKDRDTAADLTQEVFVKIFLQLDSFRGNSKFSTWIYSLTSNYCIDQIRKVKRKGLTEPIDNHDFEDCCLDIESYEEKEVELNRLIDGLEKISDIDRQILEMKYLKGLSLKEIQNELNVGESAIKMRIKRAKERLAKQHHVTAGGF